MDFLRKSTRFLALATSLLACPSWAAVELRVEARPVSEPIEILVTVTDPVTGEPVPALTEGNFTVTIDGQPVTLDAGSVELPPSQDPNQKVSVIFAMDFSPSVTQNHVDALRTAVITFIDGMNDGDFAAILKFNGDLGATVVQPFVAIDHAVNSDLLISAVNADYPGENTNIYDAVSLALQHFAGTPTLPPGPKALILASDGGENSSTVTEAEAIALANDSSIPVFTIGVGNFDFPNRIATLTDLAVETSGDFLPAPSDAEIAAAYATISELLSNEYLITLPSGIVDCAEHTIEVAVTNQGAPATATFTRRDCDTVPDPFAFTSQTGVATGANVTSNTVTITGIEVDTPISVTNGRYSIGCTETFTGDPGTIGNGQTVCLRHSTATTFSTTKVTTLNVGGVSANFASTTGAESTDKGGGGGATGLIELLLGLSLLLARRISAA